MAVPEHLKLKVIEAGSREVPSIGGILFLKEELTFWAWSPYEKCSFRCVYCSVEAQGKSTPQITEEEIPPLIEAFDEQAEGDYPFYIGVTADPYPPIEEEHLLTRHTLETLADHPDIRVILCTHGDMLTRDIDVFKSMPNIEGIGITITTHESEQIKKLEPGVPSFEKRIEAAWALYEAGLPVHVNVTPWIPGVSQPDMIARELPEDMKVNVGVLSYNEHHQEWREHLFGGRKTSSAIRVFGKEYPEQEMINDAYQKAQQEIGAGTKGNLNWLIIPGGGKSHIETLST
jgi:DNA repair photolyase